MNLTPPRQKFDVSDQVLGQAMSAYFGGRAECRIRNAPVPVCYVDFLSMYPTVNALLSLWDTLRAESVEIQDARGEAQQLLESVSLGDCFDKSLWPRFPFFAEIKPAGDVLPVRARYDPNSPNYTIGVNPVSSELPLWYSGPDLVASKLLTGKAPKVRQAWRMVPHGIQSDLQPIRLRGQVNIDPTSDDPFLRLIEERQRVKRSTMPEVERSRLSRALKTMANSAAYGINAEMNRQDLPEHRPQLMQIFGRRDPFLHETATPEHPGRYCFPPLAAAVTAGARLMLTILERCVADLGGAYAFCDTDSMAIVATEGGGPVACEGGPRRGGGGRPAVQAVSWGDVRAVIRRFEALSPYDPEAVPGSILELEEENIDPESGAQRLLHAVVISAKRHALFNLDPNGEILIRKYSEHGLGQLLNPTDPQSDSREWIREFWKLYVQEVLGDSPEWEPSWLDRPAVARVTASSPDLLQTFDELNEGKPYQDQIKPMNFVLSVQPLRERLPAALDPTQFRLIAPYTSDPQQWTEIDWIEIYSRKGYRISNGENPYSTAIPVKTYRHVLTAYRTHPEPKSCGADGQRCGQYTVGLLRRRPVEVFGCPEEIGKESNRMEEVQAGLVSDADDVQEHYREGGSWEEVREHLKEFTARQLAEKTGLTSRTVKAVRNGGTPSRKTLSLLTWAVRTLLG